MRSRPMPPTMVAPVLFAAAPPHALPTSPRPLLRPLAYRPQEQLSSPLSSKTQLRSHILHVYLPRRAVSPLRDVVSETELVSKQKEWGGECLSNLPRPADLSCLLPSGCADVACWLTHTKLSCRTHLCRWKWGDIEQPSGNGVAL